MAFCAETDGLFEIWAKETAESPLFRLAGRVEPGRFLSYIKAGLAVRGKALAEEEYRSLFWQTLAALPDEERQPVEVPKSEITKTGNGNFTCGPRVVKQKQVDLYAVRYHPLGGVVNVAFWQKLLRAVEKVEDVEFRLDFQMDLYVCNLLAEEVGLPLDSMSDGAFTAAEASPVHSFCGLCPRANCDAQMFEHVLLKETKKLGFGDGVLPVFTVAGCPDACGDISDVDLRFLAETGHGAEVPGKAQAVRDGLQEVPGKAQAVRDGLQEVPGKAQVVQGKIQEGTGKAPEALYSGSKLCFIIEIPDNSGGWRSIGRIPQRQLTEYLIALGALPQSAGLNFREWRQANAGLLEKVTALYTVSR